MLACVPSSPIAGASKSDPNPKKIDKFKTLLVQAHEALDSLGKLHQDELEQVRYHMMQSTSKFADKGKKNNDCASQALLEGALCTEAAIVPGPAVGNHESEDVCNQLDMEVPIDRLAGILPYLQLTEDQESKRELQSEGGLQTVTNNGAEALYAGSVAEDQDDADVERPALRAVGASSDYQLDGEDNDSFCQTVPSSNRSMRHVTHVTTVTHDREASIRSRAQCYHMKPLWFEQGAFDNISLQDLLAQERGSQDEEEKTQSQSYFAMSRWIPKSRGDLAPNSHWFMIHPESNLRTMWVVLCMAFLLYDLIVTPIDVCFEKKHALQSAFIAVASQIVWTVDIPFNFMTGVRTLQGLELRPTRVACFYLKSWFLFDAGLVTVEWMTYIAEKLPGRQASLFRMSRWARFMRMLRLARLLRIAKLKALVRYAVFKFHLSKIYIVATRGWIGLSCVLVMILHLLSCFWYLISSDDENGWVQVNGLASADLSRAYTISLHWSISRIHGIMNRELLENTSEILVDAMLIYFSFAFASLYIATVTAVRSLEVSNKTQDPWHLSVNFVQRHDIPSELSFRLQQVVQASYVYMGPADIADEESMLLQSLPESLKHQLLFEARRRVLVTNSLLRDLVDFNQQTVGHLCTEAVKMQVAVQSEVIFCLGDAGHNMLFVESGKLVYCTKSSDNATLESGAPISEPILWTTWEHSGCLSVLEESGLLCVNADTFAQVIVQHKYPCIHAVRYAKQFVQKMNASAYLDDLTSFPELTIGYLDDNIFQGTDEDHFIFISHYKVEAGTEATLIRDLCLPILQEDHGHPANDFRSPIFIDSEDLSDLTRLKEHVIGSAAFVLLLTPGVLSRPWCLIEIVTAIRHSANIVLVEVQRPGCSYSYPDEAFYEGIIAGRLVTPQGQELLAREGVRLEDVERAIRQIFLKIALPFSPHKSKTIREAELHDILKRCQGSEM